MRLILIIFSLIFSLNIFADSNIEVNAKYVKDNKNYIYMASKTEKLKIKKSELTKEGVQQILANKDKDLTLFIPESSVVKRTLKVPKK